MLEHEWLLKHQLRQKQRQRAASRIQLTTEEHNKIVAVDERRARTEDGVRDKVAVEECRVVCCSRHGGCVTVNEQRPTQRDLQRAVFGAVRR